MIENLQADDSFRLAVGHCFRENRFEMSTVQTSWAVVTTSKKYIVLFKLYVSVVR